MARFSETTVAAARARVPAHFALAAGAWLYWRDGAPSSVNAEYAGAAATPEALEHEIAARFGFAVALVPSPVRQQPTDRVYVCVERPS